MGTAQTEHVGPQARSGRHIQSQNTAGPAACTWPGSPPTRRGLGLAHFEPRFCGIPETVATEMIANNLIYDRDDVGDLPHHWQITGVAGRQRQRRITARVPITSRFHAA
jgi:hypothetical protein